MIAPHLMSLSSHNQSQSLTFPVFLLVLGCLLPLNHHEETNTKVEEIEEVVVDAKIETIVAWYTPQIPISNGPEQSYGLPGLILELNTKNTTMLCSKIVLNPEKKDEIIRPTKGDVVTKKEYTDMVQFKMQEMRDNRGRSRGGRWN